MPQSSTFTHLLVYGLSVRSWVFSFLSPFGVSSFCLFFTVPYIGAWEDVLIISFDFDTKRVLISYACFKMALFNTLKINKSSKKEKQATFWSMTMNYPSIGCLCLNDYKQINVEKKYPLFHSFKCKVIKQH